MFKLYLEIDAVPKSLNVKLRSHFHKNHRERLAWTNIIGYKISERPKEPLTKVSISIIRHSHRMLDYDGLVGSMKPVVDALKHLRVISDDSWSVTGAWNVSQKYRPKKEGQRLELLVQELPDKRN